MANAACTVCRDVHDTRSMRACPQCMEYVCAHCAQQHGGFCPSCDTEE